VKRVTLLDAGPLVAYLNRTEAAHARAVNAVNRLVPPLLTTEPVLTEACFLLRAVKGGGSTVLRMVHDGFLKVGLELGAEASRLEAMMGKYADVPMSLADATLIRLAERNPGAELLTFDSDFEIYRVNGKQRLSLVALE
jgi:predicted nucleic acid-binding protein